MPNPVAELIDAVSDALEASEFFLPSPAGIRESYSHDGIRQLHAHAIAGRIAYPIIHLYSMDVRTGTSELAALVKLLWSQLSPIIDETGQVSLLEEKMTLDDLAAATLRAAAILNPREAASVIHHWTSGGPWSATVNFTLTGITVSEPLSVRPGATFLRLPEQPQHIFGHVPNPLALAMQGGAVLERSGLLGATVLSFEEYLRPVLRNATQTPGYDVESTFPGGFSVAFGPFLRALSLVCNIPIVHQYSWVSSTPLQQAFFVRGAEGWGNPPAEHWPDESAVELTGPLVEQALRLADKFQAITEPERVERVFQRWINSLQRKHYLEDQLIESRIALESLYAVGGTHEASLRVAYHGARHLGRNLEERKALYKDLKDIYNTASTVIHGSLPTKREKARELVERAQNIIRDALLKILEDGKIPDWTDLMLEDR